MSTISSVTSTTTYGTASSTVNTTRTTPAAASAAAVANPFTSSSANTTSPLTYNATGLMNAFQQATAPASSSAQNARNTYLQVQDAVTQALGSLMTDPNSSNSSNTDIFGASTTSNANDPFGFTSSSGSISAPGALPTSTTAKTAKSAYQAAQDAVTQSLKSIA